MQIQKILITTAIAGALFGCGKDSDSSSSPAAGITEIQGTWATACLVSGSTSSKTTYVISGAALTGTTQNYTDTTCTTKSFSGSWGGTVAGGEAATTPTDAKKYDFTYTTLNYTANTATIVTALNTAKYCEYADWAVDVAKDGLGKKCGATTAEAISAGNVVYSIYKVSGTTMSLGIADAVNTGKTDALRAKSFDPATYTKQ